MASCNGLVHCVERRADQSQAFFQVLSLWQLNWHHLDSLYRHARKQGGTPRLASGTWMIIFPVQNTIFQSVLRAELALEAVGRVVISVASSVD